MGLSSLPRVYSRNRNNGSDGSLNKYSVKNMLYKAIYNAAIGFPISMVLNAFLLGWIYQVIHEYVWLLAAIFIGIPYFIASAVRQFLIDFVYEKYDIDISPGHLLELIGRQFKK
jgi:hypothetical protein